MFKQAITTGLLTAILGTAQATCFMVYGSANALIYRSSTSPVDLTQQIGDSVRAKFGPEASMVSSDTTQFCPELPAAEMRGATDANAASAAGTVVSVASRPAEPLSFVPEFAAGGRAEFGGVGTASSGGSSGGGRSLQTGPRGGVYYINGSGNRTYVGGGRSGRK
jgi:hypothetical protein